MSGRALGQHPVTGENSASRHATGMLTHKTCARQRPCSTSNWSAQSSASDDHIRTIIVQAGPRAANGPAGMGLYVSAAVGLCDVVEEGAFDEKPYSPTLHQARGQDAGRLLLMRLVHRTTGMCKI